MNASNESMEQKHINLTVYRNTQQDIAKIEWQASDSQSEEPQEVQAFMLSLFDAKAMQTLRLDLWSTMTLDDMNQMMYQTLLYMAETYRNATNNEELMVDMTNFAQEFAEKARAYAEKMSQG